MIKNIMAIWDGKAWSQGALDLSCYLASLTKARLTGLFPDRPTEEGIIDSYLLTNPVQQMLQPETKPQKVEAAIAAFQQAGWQKSVTVVIKKESPPPDSNLFRETLFADVIVADQEYAFLDQWHAAPSSFMTTLLTDAMCPVIVAAANFVCITEIIFAYNGGASSVFAMKQLTYLFPEFKELKITVVQVSESDMIEDYDQLQEWLEDHYSDISYEALRGDASDALFEFAMYRKDALLVMGAYGRNALFNFFNASVADSIIKYSTIPIFISHR